MASMTNHLEAALIGHVLLGADYPPPEAVYLALFTSPTNDSGEGTEVTGGDYARQPVTFGAGDPGFATNVDAVTFAAIPAGTVTHLALYDDATDGNMLLHGPLDMPVTVGAGTPVTFAAGDVEVQFT